MTKNVLNEKVFIVATSNTWIEGNAVSQLQGTAQLPGMIKAVGLPDLHPGKNGPVGAVFASDRLLYPHLIGNDIGCGMALWQTDIKARKLKLDRWQNQIADLDRPWDGDRVGWLERFNTKPTQYDNALGTVGGGNHFVELQIVEHVADAETFKALGLDTDRLLVLVHSGSRRVGEEVHRAYRERHGHEGLIEDSEGGVSYLGAHQSALAWAVASRALLCHRFMESLRAGGRPVLDVPHNFVEAVVMNGRSLWLHRKGAVSSGRGPVVIPGSRGALSYLVAPLGDQEENLRSLAHGAGRKWARNDCHARLGRQVRPEDLARSKIGSRVICEDRELLYQEAPEAYKRIEQVIDALMGAGLVRVIATFRPLITFKTRRRSK